MCCSGHPALLLSHDLSHQATVSPFKSSLGTVTDFPIASVAIAYDCPITSTQYILIFHQVLYMADMPDALLNPNQLRFNGVDVSDCPLTFIPPSQRLPTSHAIITPEIQNPLSSNFQWCDQLLQWSLSNHE
jgi:hypothetical protein